MSKGIASEPSSGHVIRPSRKRVKAGPLSIGGYDYPRGMS